MAVNRILIGNIKGKQGATGAKIISQVLQGQDENGGYIYLQTFDDGTTQTFTAPRGATGEMGFAGADGKTPFIGANGNWFIGEEDTGIKAQGQDGANGVGITEITSGESYEEEGNTITPITVKTSDGNETTLNIKAKNGVGNESEDSGNLLSEPITIETWTKQENGFVIPTLNLNADKSYVFKGVMGVDNTPFEVKSSQTMSGSEMGLDGAIAVFTDAYNEVLFLVYDKMLIVDNAPVIDDSKAQIQIDCTDLSNINNTNQPITLESITEAQVEYATKEEVEALDERVTALEEGGSATPSGEPLVATFSITSANTAIRVKNLTGATVVDWGDGSAIEDISSGTTYTHTYVNIGTYTAKFYGYISQVGELAFGNNVNLTSIVLPNSVETIGISAFSDCQNLISISTSFSLKTIGEKAFDNCYSLQCITIPQNTTHIGARPFRNTNLKLMIVQAITPPTQDGYFFTSVSTAPTKIIVPFISLEQYKTAENWSTYASKIDAYAMASTIDDINTQLTNIVEGEGV